VNGSSGDSTRHPHIRSRMLVLASPSTPSHQARKRCQHARPCWRAAPRVRRKAYAASNGADPGAGLRGDCARNREIANRQLRPGKAAPFSGGARLCTSNWDVSQMREPPRGAGDGPHPGAAARRRRGRRHRRGEGAFCRCRGRETAARREPPRASAVRKAGQKLSIDWGQALRTPAGAGARPANVARLGCVQRARHVQRARQVSGSAAASSRPTCGNQRGELPW
jgi:hypothetical protein